MGYSITRQQLNNNPLLDTLCALKETLAPLGIDIFVVGAVARDIMMAVAAEPEVKRRTADLDVAICIPSWPMYGKVSEALIARHFQKMKAKQKFAYRGPSNDNHYEVDIVPFGPVAENEEIRWWPEGEPVMSVKCYEDVMAHAVEVNIAGKVSVKMAPMCGQFLIKLDAWIDRHHSTRKDAEDMCYLLKRYYSAHIMLPGTDIPPEVAFNDDTHNFIIPGAQWLAYDIRKILSREHLDYYTAFIRQQLDKAQESDLLQQFATYLDIDDSDNFDITVRIWQTISDSLQKGLSE